MKLYWQKHYLLKGEKKQIKIKNTNKQTKNIGLPTFCC